MNKDAVILAFLLILLCVGCSTEYGVELRIENQSKFDFDNLSVNNVPFGSLAKNEVSGYVPFESLYDRELIQIEIDGRNVKYVPTSFDEEEYRNTGKYKYVIDIINLEEISVSRISE